MLNLKPQARMVLNHLTSRGSISQLEALHVYGIMRLAACIYDLRQIGIQIKTRYKKDMKKKRYARYEVKAA
jgi:hypothetical protein